MMTLAQFYATHRLPNAIVVPGRITRLLKRRSESGITVAPQAATPAPGLEAPQLLRRLRGDGSRGKKH